MFLFHCRNIPFTRIIIFQGPIFPGAYDDGRMQRSLTVPTLLLAACISLDAQDNAPALRLPDTVRPVRYSASLRLVPGQNQFSGDIQIELNILKSTDTIWLNAKSLELKGGSISAGGTTLPVGFRSAPNDFLAVKTSSNLAPGRAVLDISYTGEVSRTLTDGAFQQQQGNDWYIFSKFEPVTARRVFPCFDEPGFKVPWQLTINVPKALKVFSNTPAESEEARNDNTKTVRFQQTRPLPSYLVAFAVGPFDVVPTAPIGRNHRPGNIIVPRGRASEAAYAASVTPKLIGLLENYFGTPYPYEKLDQVVVPLTTAWGAMENAGLIAYGDFLLSPPRQETQLRQRGQAAVMEHEMSHQWFGDLVTTAWWDDIWLNEAFASWLESKLLNEWKPDWNIKSDAARSINVMRADSLTTARRIRQPIEAPGDIANAFDGITYGKGEAVIGMFENYVGPEAFQKAVRLYLEQHQWGNATASDLLSAIDQVSPQSGAGAAFSTFLNQVGFPLVTATVRCAGNPSQVQLTQTRFLPVGSPATPGQLWQVPVCAVWNDAAGAHRDCKLLTKASDTWTLNGLRGCPTWFSADSSATGYYAVSYEPAAVAGNLVRNGLPNLQPAEAAATLRNIQLMFSSGLGDLHQDLGFAQHFSRSTDAGLVRQSAGLVESVSSFVPDNLHAEYAAWIRSLYQASAHELGWNPKPGESPEIRQLRIEIVPLVATRGEDSELQGQAAGLAHTWLKERTSLDPDMVVPVLSTAAWNGNRAFFEELVNAIRQTKVRRERQWIIAALPAFRDPTLAQAALDLIFEPGVDPREFERNLLAASDENREILWKFVQQNFDRLNNTLPGARGIPFGANLPLAAAGFCDASHREQVDAFFQPRIANLPGGARNLANTLERIELCAARAGVVQPAAASFMQGK